MLEKGRHGKESKVKYCSHSDSRWLTDTDGYTFSSATLLEERLQGYYLADI